MICKMAKSMSAMVSSTFRSEIIRNMERGWGCLEISFRRYLVGLAVEKERGLVTSWPNIFMPGARLPSNSFRA